MADNYFDSSGSLDDIGELIRVVRKVMQGHLILDNVLIEKLIGYYERHASESGHLSPRELEVIYRGCKGMTVQEIASDLQSSPEDVEVIQGLLEDGVKRGEFPKVDPHLMFKALGGLFMGLVFMGDRKEPVTDKDVESLLNKLITDPNLNN